MFKPNSFALALAACAAVVGTTLATTSSDLTKAVSKLDAATAALGKKTFPAAATAVTGAKALLVPTTDFPRTRAELTAAQQAITAHDVTTATRRIANAKAILAGLSGTSEGGS